VVALIVLRYYELYLCFVVFVCFDCGFGFRFVVHYGCLFASCE